MSCAAGCALTGTARGLTFITGFDAASTLSSSSSISSTSPVCRSHPSLVVVGNEAFAWLMKSSSEASTDSGEFGFRSLRVLMSFMDPFPIRFLLLGASAAS